MYVYIYFVSQHKRKILQYIFSLELNMHQNLKLAYLLYFSSLISGTQVAHMQPYIFPFQL